MTSQKLVHHLIAGVSQRREDAIDDARTLAELELDLLDVVLIALRIEALDGMRADFPVAALEHVRTVGDLVLVVDRWAGFDAAGNPSTALARIA
jgi:acyl carrier protein